MLMCILVVLKAHVCASLSSHPLCLFSVPSAWGSPRQSSRFLPSPSQLTTQQVERWSLRALLWPGSPCPSISMMCPARALLPAGRLPGRAGVGAHWPCLSSSPWAALSSALCLWCLLSCSSCSRFCVAGGLHWQPDAPRASAFPSSPSRQGGCMCPAHLFRPWL